jgi:hypothetical protein
VPVGHLKSIVDKNKKEERSKKEKSVAATAGAYTSITNGHAKCELLCQIIWGGE